MINIILDGKVIKDRKTLFKSLKEQINSESFIGNNLDALYDELSYLEKKVIVQILDEQLLIDNLDKYYVKLINVFEELNILVERQS